MTVKRYNDWRDSHFDVMTRFLRFVNQKTDQFILKGGTSLLFCYGLDRFSEDIDFDCCSVNIIDYVEKFCGNNHFSFRVAKNTETVKRCMINYNGKINRPLKIEVSYRNRTIDQDHVVNRNGIAVYDINTICIMKSLAYSGRDKIRDLYDLAFICKHFWDELSSETRMVMRQAVGHKGIEQFEYLASDYLVDSEQLETDFLEMLDRLDLFDENEGTVDEWETGEEHER